MTYQEMLAGRGLAIGDKVICEYRLPTAHQFWVAPFWVGVVEDAGTDKADWNGHNSEEHYCVLVGSVKVRYLNAGSLGEFTQHDSLGSLRAVSGNHARSPWFGSEDFRGVREFAAQCGLLDRFRVYQLRVAA